LVSLFEGDNSNDGKGKGEDNLKIITPINCIKSSTKIHKAFNGLLTCSNIGFIQQVNFAG